MGILWHKSGSIERDNNDVRAGGAKAFFYAGGTTTPISVYQDAAETTPHSSPVEAASSGRWPAIYIPFRASYDVKVTTEGGTQLFYYEEIPNADPVEAAEDTVDENAVFLTGMWSFDTVGGTKAGWVRANGRTIGSAASGATERANADTEDLYTRLYDNHADSILAVTGGRGASAAADFAANKPIALPNARSAYIIGVDDMGNSAASLGFGGSFVTGNATTGGSIGGTNTHTLVSGEMPAHTHSFSATTSADGAHQHTGNTGSTNESTAHVHSGGQASNQSAGAQAGAGVFAWSSSPQDTGLTSVDHTHAFTTNSSGSHTHTVSGTSGSTGSGGAHNNMPRAIHGTFFIKL